MRVLLLHSDHIEFEPKKKAIKGAEEVKLEKIRVEEALVAFVSVEKGDEADPEEAASMLVDEIEKVAKQVDARRVVIYPWVHLTNDPAQPGDALRILKIAEGKLKDKFEEVVRAPFGWYKAFEVRCKGHPLAELSRTIGVGEKKESEREEEISEALKAEEKLKSYWYIMTPDGELIPVEEFDFSEHPELKKFADYEISKVRAVDQVPPHVKLMREMELVDYEPGSDAGNLRWYPKGELIKNLLEDHVTNLLLEYGAMKVETPIMYDFNHPNLSKYLHRFPARQYVVYSGSDRYFLRFAACFGQYLIKHDMIISYKHLPVRLYELTHYSFRREQKGELVGLRRLRCFTMPDMHTLVADVGQAKQEFVNQMKLAMKWMEDLQLDYEVAIRFVRDFYEENKDFIKSLVKMLNKPVLIEMWEERPFYFILKFEFNVVDCLGKASALSTVQIDIENAERFDIIYVDKDGSKKHPLILHASISGSIDRNLYAILERQWMRKERGEKPCFPLWIAPTQVRICPVSDEYLDHALQLLEKIRKENIRVDIDDRDITLAKKIMEAEKEWVPYIVVVGKKEVETGRLSIRVREKNKQIDMSVEELIEEIREKTRGKPFRLLYLPEKLSKRPQFVG